VQYARSDTFGPTAPSHIHKETVSWKDRFLLSHYDQKTQGKQNHQRGEAWKSWGCQTRKKSVQILARDLTWTMHNPGLPHSTEMNLKLSSSESSRRMTDERKAYLARDTACFTW